MEVLTLMVFTKVSIVDSLPQRGEVWVGVVGVFPHTPIRALEKRAEGIIY
jgi:hypothetical protein